MAKAGTVHRCLQQEEQHLFSCWSNVMQCCAKILTAKLATRSSIAAESSARTIVVFIVVAAVVVTL